MNCSGRRPLAVRLVIAEERFSCEQAGGIQIRVEKCQKGANWMSGIADSTRMAKNAANVADG